MLLFYFKYITFWLFQKKKRPLLFSKGQKNIGGSGKKYIYIDIWHSHAFRRGSVRESFAAFQILPKLIAEYLFDPKEDEKLLEIIKNMQDYNSHQHDNLNKHH